MKTLNLGCGTSKIKGTISGDIDPSVEPDIVFDLEKPPYPFQDSSIDCILFLHVIEHLEEHFHFTVLKEFYRIISATGRVIIAYPEFKKCAQNYIDNKCGMRGFWKATIYGRQIRPDDYHISLMDTSYFIQTIEQAGFIIDEVKQEQTENYNTIMIARKGTPGLTREEGIRKELFGDKLNDTTRTNSDAGSFRDIT